MLFPSEASPKEHFKENSAALRKTVCRQSCDEGGRVGLHKRLPRRGKSEIFISLILSLPSATMSGCKSFQLPWNLFTNESYSQVSQSRSAFPSNPSRSFFSRSQGPATLYLKFHSSAKVFSTGPLQPESAMDSCDTAHLLGVLTSAIVWHHVLRLV
jgi:hypothetical protein